MRTAPSIAIAMAVAALLATRSSAVSEEKVTYKVTVAYSARAPGLKDQCPYADHERFGGAPVAKKLPLKHEATVISRPRGQELRVDMGIWKTDVVVPFTTRPGAVQIRQNANVLFLGKKWGKIPPTTPIELEGATGPAGFTVKLRFRMDWVGTGPYASRKGWCILEYTATGTPAAK